MNEVVLRNEAAAVTALPAADCNNEIPSTIRIKNSAAIETKTREIAPIGERSPPIKANCTIPRIGWVSEILTPTPYKNANIAIVKIVKPKIVKAASNVGAWDIFSVIAAVCPNF